MLKPSDIVEIFALLEASGIQRPRIMDSQEGQRTALKVWMSCFADLTPEEAKAATAAYIRAGERFWPTPGVILGYAPHRELDANDLLSTKNDRFERLHASLVAQGVPWLKATDMATRHLWMGEPIPDEYRVGAAA